MYIYIYIYIYDINEKAINEIKIYEISDGTQQISDQFFFFYSVEQYLPQAICLVPDKVHIQVKDERLLLELELYCTPYKTNLH